MTRSLDAIAADLILQAEKRRVRISREYAVAYINARQALHADPSDASARRTVCHFETLLSEFGRFTLPFEDWLRHCADFEERAA